MVKIQDQIDKIEYTKREIKRTQSWKRKKDLKRSLYRLERELYKCLSYMEARV